MPALLPGYRRRPQFKRLWERTPRRGVGGCSGGWRSHDCSCSRLRGGGSGASPVPTLPKPTKPIVRDDGHDQPQLPPQALPPPPPTLRKCNDKGIDGVAGQVMMAMAIHMSIPQSPAPFPKTLSLSLSLPTHPLHVRLSALPSSLFLCIPSWLFFSLWRRDRVRLPTLSCAELLLAPGSSVRSPTLFPAR